MPLVMQPRLNETHLEKMNAILQAAAAAGDYCAKCEAAGLDMSGYRATLSQQAELAAGLKRTFFPTAS